MNKEIINSHIDAILEEISEPINHNFDTLEELNDRVYNIEQIIENSSLEYNCLYDISDKLDDVMSDIRDLEEDYKARIKALSSIDISHDLNDKILDQVLTLDAKIDNSNDALKLKSSELDKSINNQVLTLDAKIDNLSNVIDGLLNGKIRLIKRHNKLVEVILKLSHKAYNMMRVGLAKIKGINKRLMERSNKTS